MSAESYIKGLLRLQDVPLQLLQALTCYLDS